MISTVDSELTSTCTGKENKTLVFVFDVFHEDFMTKQVGESVLFSLQCTHHK